MIGLRFFNPYAEIRQTENRLPHWQQEGAVYFVTFQLGDAIPSHLRNEWENDREAWTRVHPEPWNAEVEREYHQRFSGAIEQWLDAGHGACLLRRSDCAQIVAETLPPFRRRTCGNDFVRRHAEPRARAVRPESGVAAGEVDP